MTTGAKTEILIFINGAFKRCMRTQIMNPSSFCWGLTEGAYLCGGIALSVYVMPDEEASMRKDEHPEEVERALLALDKARAT